MDIPDWSYYLFTTDKVQRMYTRAARQEPATYDSILLHPGFHLLHLPRHYSRKNRGVCALTEQQIFSCDWKKKVTVKVKVKVIKWMNISDLSVFEYVTHLSWTWLWRSSSSSRSQSSGHGAAQTCWEVIERKEVFSPLTFSPHVFFTELITSVYDRPPNLPASLMNTCSDQVETLLISSPRKTFSSAVILKWYSNLLTV